MTIAGEIPIDSYLRIIGYKPKPSIARKVAASASLVCALITGLVCGRLTIGQALARETLSAVTASHEQEALITPEHQSPVATIQRDAQMAIEALAVAARDNDAIERDVCQSLRLIANQATETIQKLASDDQHPDHRQALDHRLGR